MIKDETTGEAIGLEILSYRPGDDRFDTVTVSLPLAMTWTLDDTQQHFQEIITGKLTLG